MNQYMLDFHIVEAKSDIIEISAIAEALFQPGIGATVVWTHTTKVALGSVLPII